MYIPMNENETKQFKMPEPYGVELTVRPFTGENEVYFFEQVEAGSKIEVDQERVKPIKNIFNKFVKGYIHPQTGVPVTFDGDDLPSSHFGLKFISAFANINTLSSINMLTVEEKKS
jgi:hypothetical protein